uniref:Uncharacterized protein n=1 Tax=Ciona savignyi TaxID=51511 RepID=H2Z9E8_CIOSA
MHRHSVAQVAREPQSLKGSTHSSFALASHSQIFGQHPAAIEIGSSPFITVNYGDGHALVNVDCAILHLFLHLRARYLEDGWQLEEDVLLTGPPVLDKPVSPTKEDKTKKDHHPKTIKLFTCFDLMDEAPMPLELCNKEPMAKVRNFVSDRGTYMLCVVKRTETGIIKEAHPLLLKTSMELRRRIDTVLRSLERSSKRKAGRVNDRLNPAKTIMANRRETRKSFSGPSNRTFASVVRDLNTQLK